MPITLAELKKGKRTIPVAMPEGTVTITYRAGEVTQAAFDETARIIDLIPKWVESWDLTDNGEPYPITQESVDHLPQGFLAAIFDAILEDSRNRPTKRPGSMKSG